LVKVCIIGGRTAGEVTAFESSLRGVEVTNIERRANREARWGSWPDLISRL